MSGCKCGHEKPGATLIKSQCCHICSKFHSSIVVPNNAGNLEAYCRQCPDDVTL